jgi:predicted murein hydrolase (TIGR00659 family)
MKELLTESVYLCMVLTLVCYQIGLAVKRRVSFPLANPLLVGAVLIIGVLVSLDMEYEIYQASVRPISFLLTPATVCLAIPLYRQLSLLKKYPVAILGGVLSGVLTAMVSIFFLSLAFGLTHVEYVSILPKSITTAIGMGVSEKMGGVVALTVISISISGISGTILADIWLKLLRIREPIAKGLALGTAAHALGASKAMELGEIEGAMSSLSIVVTGILSVIAVSFFAPLI